MSHATTPFVPCTSGLTTIFNSGNVGITKSMLQPGQDSDPNKPGLANFESTIFKGLQKPFDPQIKVVSSVGTIIDAGKKFPTLTDPVEIAEFLAEKIVKPVKQGIEMVGKFIPPSASSIGGLVTTPISENLKTPSFAPFSFSLAGLSIPFPAFGSGGTGLPTMTNASGTTAPPLIHVVLGIMMVPVNIMLDLFKGISDFFTDVVSPTTMGDAIVNVLKLPTKLLPTMSVFQTAIGIPFTPTMTTFVTKVLEAMINMFKMLFGLPHKE